MDPVSLFARSEPANFVLAAAVIGFITALTTFRLFNRVLNSSGVQRVSWLFLNAVAMGLGIWSCNFLLLLADQPAMAVVYDPLLVLLSATVAVTLALPVSNIVLRPRVTEVAVVGGAYIAVGLGYMQLLSLSALKTTSPIVWRADWMASGVLVGFVFAATALYLARPSRHWHQRMGGALALTMAVAGQHILMMRGVVVDTAVRAELPVGLTAEEVATGILVISSLLVGGALIISILDQRRQSTSRRRVRELLDAALEGLVLCENGRIIEANSGFRDLVGVAETQITRKALTDFLAPASIGAVPAIPGVAVELELRSTSGETVPVSVVMRELRTNGSRRLAYAVRDLRAHRQAQERIEFLAHHDPLTGLPNRVTFADELALRLSEMGETGGRLAVLALDLDRFKEVNDVFGHATGDKVLVETAARLSAAIGPGDVLARIGGDEFVIIQAGGSGEAQSRMAERLIASIGEEYQVDGKSISLGLSIGIAIYPIHGTTAADLLANADVALYRAKADGRGTQRMYDAEMDGWVRSRRALAHDLRSALAENQLQLHFQPQASVVTGEIVGFEALLRWYHPRRGFVPPSEFVAIAEETGMVLEIGDWALEEACRVAASWRNPLKIAVNVSAVQFQHGDLPERVATTLLRTGLGPSRLEIEITETLLFRDFHRALATLRRLKSLGVQIAMDDFGTGYSSLSNLQSFPFDKLKIDRAFISRLGGGPQPAAIVRAVLDLGRALAMTVVAEGVETSEQLRFLAAEGCHEAQGFLIAKPRPIEEFADVTSGNRAVKPRLAGRAA